MNLKSRSAEAAIRPAHLFAFCSLLLPVALAVACSGGSGPAAPGGAPGGGMPPMPVEAITLANKPVEQVSEFVASLKSRRSSTIQSQAEGYLTRIAVRSGQHVSVGTLLFEIDSAPEQAALASLQSMRPMREAELSYAQQQVARNKALLEAGAVSQREVEQFETTVRTTEAQIKALDEQIKQQRSMLGYYRVTAPSAGVVGDIRVVVGDRITKSTMLTTVDENDVLEVYINVPVQQAPLLKVGLPVRLVDDRGQLIATNKIDFVSPNVDTATQTVLAKAQLVEGRGQFRADQFVRARVVWSEAPGLTVPVTGVLRINGQYFVFVAEKGGPGTVAKQKPVDLGVIIGNEYVVRSGLSPGEQLIVSGLQKIGDGAPVQVGAAAPAAEKKAS
jgi:RND family efflux transporter MFP subunit